MRYLGIFRIKAMNVILGNVGEQLCPYLHQFIDNPFRDRQEVCRHGFLSKLLSPSPQNHGSKGLETPAEASSPHLVPEPRHEGKLLQIPERLELPMLIFLPELAALFLRF